MSFTCPLGREELISMFKNKGNYVNWLSILISPESIIYFKYHAFRDRTDSNVIMIHSVGVWLFTFWGYHHPGSTTFHCHKKAINISNMKHYLTLTRAYYFLVPSSNYPISTRCDLLSYIKNLLVGDLQLIMGLPDKKN
jgi:hypothetical protein